jgi:predicted GNAT family acetyltransferase
MTCDSGQPRRAPCRFICGCERVCVAGHVATCGAVRRARGRTIRRCRQYRPLRRSRSHNLGRRAPSNSPISGPHVSPHARHRTRSSSTCLEDLQRDSDPRAPFVRGGRASDRLIYRAQPGLIAFVHTEVEDRFEGHGVGSVLIREALEEARRRGFEVLPLRPFVNSFIAEHREFVDLVPGPRREEFGL